MREEVSRIMKLVQEGKLSPEDAAELIEVFARDAEPEPPTEAAAGASEASGEQKAKATTSDSERKDPLKGFTDFMNNLERDVRESVDWKEVANQAKLGAQKGLDALKKAAEEIKTGSVNFSFFGSTEIKEVTLPLTVPEGKTLRIENPCGSVRVSGGFADGTVNAKAKVRGASVDDARARAEDYTLVVEESDHSVIIRQPRIASLAVDLVVQLSSAANVEIKTESGDVTVLDTGAGMKVTSQSGDVSLRGLNGPIDVTAQSGDLTITDSSSPMISVESKSGDVKLERLDANVNLRVASGDVQLNKCKGKTISVESVSGNVTADFEEAVTGSVNIRTVNGDAKVHVPDGCDCRVSLSTLRGDTVCELELADEAKSDQRITGRLGDGNGSIDVSGINGDISLSLHDSAAVA